ncbi:hypothetical protein QVD17_39263 [Tagetes erecta]|uniref:Uncharacterized protein n=1 Tax=Tagetes erecta TaxID=13708 RepID=A0AAD8NG29_TARER|nr:hypothetical protein QVD17_39263 [Tagetes erecta]
MMKIAGDDEAKKIKTTISLFLLCYKSSSLTHHQFPLLQSPPPLSNHNLPQNGSTSPDPHKLAYAINLSAILLPLGCIASYFHHQQLYKIKITAEQDPDVVDNVRNLVICVFFLVAD